jgi:hypothetical protein
LSSSTGGDDDENGRGPQTDWYDLDKDFATSSRVPMDSIACGDRDTLIPLRAMNVLLNH